MLQHPVCFIELKCEWCWSHESHGHSGLRKF